MGRLGTCAEVPLLGVRAATQLQKVHSEMKHRQASPSAVCGPQPPLPGFQVQTSSKVSGVCCLSAKSLGKGRVPTSWENSPYPRDTPGVRTMEPEMDQARQGRC